MSLTEHVAQTVEAHLADGTWKAGDRLPGERDLCERLKVSRPVLREAMRALEQRGLLEIQPGRGTFVRPRNFDAVVDSLVTSMRQEGLSFWDLMEGREHLEVQIARLAAQRRTAEDLELIAASLAVMEANLDDAPQFMQADQSFHLELAQATQNPIYTIWIRPIIDTLAVTRRSIGSLGRVREHALDCHRDIYVAIRAGDAEAADRAARHHLDQFLDDTAYAAKLGVINFPSGAPVERDTGKRSAM